MATLFPEGEIHIYCDGLRPLSSIFDLKASLDIYSMAQFGYKQIYFLGGPLEG